MYYPNWYGGPKCGNCYGNRMLSPGEQESIVRELERSGDIEVEPLNEITTNPAQSEDPDETDVCFQH